VGLPTNGGAEGSYLIVNKNLVEALALCLVAAFPATGFFGIERFAATWLARLRDRLRPQAPPPGPPLPAPSRRDLIRSAVGIPALGGFAIAVFKKRGFDSFEEKLLRASGQTDAVSSATLKTFQYTTLKELKARSRTPGSRASTSAG